MVFGVVWSTITWPPSPLAWSNHRVLASDLRSVPLSWVPPQYWPGMFGTVAIEENWLIARTVEWMSAAVLGLTWPLRSCQSADDSGEPAAFRPPPVCDSQTPPSLPMATCALSLGSNANAWKSGCKSRPRFFQVAPPSVDRKTPPDGGLKL